MLYLRAKNRKAAIEELELSFQAIRAKGDDQAEILKYRQQDQTQLAALLVEETRYHEAKTLFRTMLSVSPDDGSLHNGYGAVLMQARECKEASDEFQQALRLEPRNAYARANFAFCEAQLGDSEKALNALKQQAEDSRYDEWSANALAWFYCTVEDPKFRNPTEAVRLATIAVEKTNATDAEVLDTLAEAQLLSGKATDALATELKAVQADPENTEIQDRLAGFQTAAKEAKKH